MSDTRIPVYLTHDEAETLLEMPAEHQGQRCGYCSAWWAEGVGYDHDERCVLLGLRAAAEAAIPVTERRLAYAEYQSAIDERKRAQSDLAERGSLYPGNWSVVWDARRRLMSAECAERESLERYEAACLAECLAEAAERRGETEG